MLSTIDADTAAAGVLGRFGVVVDELLALDCAALSGDGLLELLREVEVARRRLVAVDHGLVAEVDGRGLAADLHVRDTTTLLVEVLRVSPAEAKRRVVGARELGPRRSLSGQVLPALFPRLAAAQCAGSISAEHAAVIVKLLDYLPGEVDAQYGQWAQTYLLEQAVVSNPAELAQTARVLAERLNPDGVLTEAADHDRHRGLTLARRNDGSYHLTGRLTPLCGALWEPIFDSLARPLPAADATPDPRRPDQRRHDGFEQAATLLIRADQLPATGGVAATLLLTLTADQFLDGTGYATTGHGNLIATPQALDLLGDAHTLAVRLDPTGGIMSYGQQQRLATAPQRLALAARDGGCTTPNCFVPPSWCETHHFREFVAEQGPTDIDNLGLVCAWHHRHYKENGWHGTMINGIPHWIPPPHIDPDQTPRRNTVHHLTRMITTPPDLSQAQP